MAKKSYISALFFLTMVLSSEAWGQSVDDYSRQGSQKFCGVTNRRPEQKMT
jgi:hypothetical protein